MPADSIDRLYRGLFAHATQFQDLVVAETSRIIGGESVAREASAAFEQLGKALANVSFRSRSPDAPQVKNFLHIGTHKNICNRCE
jgi:hypothetical protein